MVVWLSDPYQPRPALTGEAKADVVVIGGGITGIAAAYYLAQRKIDVLLVERGALACGATGRNAGFLLAGTSHPYSIARQAFSPIRAKDLWRLSMENHELIRGLIQTGIDCGYARNGSARAAETAKEQSLLRSSAVLLREDGFDVEFLEGEAARAIVPGERFHGALVNRADGEFHPVRFVRGLAGSAERAGAKIFENTRVLEWNSRGTEAVISTEKGRVHASMVLFAANAYTGLLAPYFEDVITPVRGQMLSTAPLARRIMPMPVYADSGYQYFRQLEDGRILMGGGRKQSVETELTLSDKSTDKIQNFLGEYLVRHFPETRGVAITDRWAGTMGFSCDELPNIGPLPGVVNAYVSAGYHGHGLGFAVVAAKMVTEMMIDGKTDRRAEMFSPRRHAL